MTTQLPTAKKTKQKFYNKFVYKTNLRIKASELLRYYSFDQIIDNNLLYDPKVWTRGNDRFRDAVIELDQSDKERFLNFLNLLKTYDKKDYQLRIEGLGLDVYTNEDDLYETLCSDFSENIERRWAPEQGQKQEILNSTRKIFVKHLPHFKYAYKVFLHPHKIQGDRKSIVEWFSKQTDKTSISDSIVQWMLKQNQNWDRRYILVEDDQTVLMLRLRCPELIGPVHQYVIKA